MRKFLCLFIFHLFCCAIFGQITTDEETVSFKMNVPVLTKSEKTQKILPALDMNRIAQEDKKDEESGTPPRFGYKHEVSYNLDNSGEWLVLDNDDRIWRLNISCPGALSINLLYDQFWIPDGAKFFVYNNDRKHTIGAITNKGDKENIIGYATGLMYGDQITLEYYLPKEVKEVGIISVAYVVHGYRYIFLSENNGKSEEGSADCHINVNCSQGNDWKNEKNAIAMILINGNRVCTGALVNNTANDYAPYFLTASHCLYGSDAEGSFILSHWTFYWHYESPWCWGTSPTILATTGARVVANSNSNSNGFDHSDFALLYLEENPRYKSGVTPFYLGWDRSGVSGTGGVGIHHPVGDIKKISTYTMTPISTNYLYDAFDTNGSHWRVVWSSGITESKSSGSPLINNDQKLIGQLHGGWSSCDVPDNSDWYGKFSVSWTGSKTGTPVTSKYRRLNYWLDPLSIDPPTLDGRGLCRTYYGYQSVTNRTTIFGCDALNVQNVDITNGGKLTVVSGGEVTIEDYFEVVDGSEFEIK